MGQGWDRKDRDTRPLCKTRVLKKRVVALKKDQREISREILDLFQRGSRLQ